MKMTETWSPDDPFDAMAESVRLQVTDIALELQAAAIFRDLPPHRQLECFVAGVATALVGVSFAHIKEDGRDEIMEFIIGYLPQARKNAEGLLADPGRRALEGANTPTGESG